MVCRRGEACLARKNTTLTKNQRMTFDQKIQVILAVGTWFAAIGTIAAVVVALYLVRRTEKVRLKTHVGLRVLVGADGQIEHLNMNVTNVGEKPVTVNSIGWAIGKGKERRYCIQPVYGKWTSQYPVELSHGKSVDFMVSFLDVPDWLYEFSTGFVKDLSNKSIKTLVAQIFTSVGQTIEVRPEGNLIERLREVASSATV